MTCYFLTELPAAPGSYTSESVRDHYYASQDDSPSPGEGSRFLSPSAAHQYGATSNSRKRKGNSSNQVQKQGSHKSSCTRPEDANQIKESKRQLRLMRNRASAQLSRERKKAYISELEARFEAVELNNQKLSAQVVSLTVENASLKLQIRNMEDGGSTFGRQAVPITSFDGREDRSTCGMVENASHTLDLDISSETFQRHVSLDLSMFGSPSGRKMDTSGFIKCENKSFSPLPPPPSLPEPPLPASSTSTYRPAASSFTHIFKRGRLLAVLGTILLVLVHWIGSSFLPGSLAPSRVGLKKAHGRMLLGWPSPVSVDTDAYYSDMISTYPSALPSFLQPFVWHLAMQKAPKEEASQEAANDPNLRERNCPCNCMDARSISPDDKSLLEKSGGQMAVRVQYAKREPDAEGTSHPDSND